MERDKDKNLARVFHYDLYGKRSEKYDFLRNNSLQTVPWIELELTEPQYFFVQKDFSLKKEYEQGFSVQELFPVNSVGIVTTRDELLMKDNPEQVKALINDFIALDDAKLRVKYNIGSDSRDWSIARAKSDIGKTADKSKIVAVNYRPFDRKYLYYTGKTNGLVARPRGQVMRHFAAEIFFGLATHRQTKSEENVGLMICRQQKTNGFYHCLVHDNIVESSFVSNKTSEIGYSLPLYLYREGNVIDGVRMPDKRIPNLNETIIKKISQQIGAQFTCESEDTENTFSPIDVLDYIYAVLHSPAYRERYKEFLKIDFPRVPYPENAGQFWHMVELGSKLRRLHLLEDVEPQEGMADYPVAGNNVVEKLRYVDDKVYINDTQYFDNVPLAAWTFYIGGYQPAQKWLKDRKGRTLNYEDIRHYQRIIVVLTETKRLMENIK